MSFIAKNNLEEGFEEGDNEEEIRKYGIQQKGGKFKNKIVYVIILFAFLFFFISVFLLYLVNDLKKELKSANSTKNDLKYKLKEFVNQLEEQKERIEFLNEIEKKYPFIKNENGDNIDVIDSKMDYDMEQYAIEIAREAYYYNKNEHGIADYIREKFDQKYNKFWQCIVGLSFTYNIWQKKNEFIYFSLGQFKVLLFRNKTE